MTTTSRPSIAIAGARASACAFFFSLPIALITPTATAQEEQTEDKEPLSRQEALGQGDSTKFKPTTRYVHEWLRLPKLVGRRLPGSGDFSFGARQGHMSVVVFLASWCEPCQEIIEDVIRIERKYTRMHTRFAYVFAHDTRRDAEGFMKEYGMRRGMLSNTKILMSYHNPKLPTIYIGDRHGWLANRYEDTKREDIVQIERFLKYQTAY